MTILQSISNLNVVQWFGTRKVWAVVFSVVGAFSEYAANNRWDVGMQPEVVGGIALLTVVAGVWTAYADGKRDERRNI